MAQTRCYYNHIQLVNTRPPTSVYECEPSPPLRVQTRSWMLEARGKNAHAPSRTCSRVSTRSAPGESRAQIVPPDPVSLASPPLPSLPPRPPPAIVSHLSPAAHHLSRQATLGSQVEEHRRWVLEVADPSVGEARHRRAVDNPMVRRPENQNPHRSANSFVRCLHMPRGVARRNIIHLEVKYKTFRGELQRN